MEDKWKTVKDFPAYEVSNSQGIRNKATKKILKGRNWIGYPKVTLMRDGKKHERRIHKIVAEHFVKNKDPKKYIIVNHKDSDRSNFKSSNLEYMTQQENMLHRWKTEKEGLKKEKYGHEYGKNKKREKMESKALKKFASAKHKGIFYYLSKAHKMGVKFPKKTSMEYLKIKKAIKNAKLHARKR